MSQQPFELFAVSALDGRYRSKVDQLSPFVSEAGLIDYRIRVEAAWLLALAEDSVVGKDIDLSDSATVLLKELAVKAPTEAFEAVKKHESITNHDVKAVEYYLRDALAAVGVSPQTQAFIHFACTSEDINNLSYALMLKDVREKVLLVDMNAIISNLSAHATDYKNIPMLSRTHGQTATPTTLGKELVVFAHRLDKEARVFAKLPIDGKINGAVGNYNAHSVAYPEVNWMGFAKNFIEGKLGLDWNPITTQIENHDSMCAYFDSVKRFNTISLGLCRDIWGYISLGYFSQVLKAGEVGSSTMPHKVNPIDFENAEGNFGVASSLATHLSEKLPISRWQRDLSDSTVQRTLGTVCGHSLLAYKSLLKGLGKIKVNEANIAKDLDGAWEVLGEAVQTVMRRYGVLDAYERLKAATRGQSVTRDGLHQVVDDCEQLPAEVKSRLKAMTPASYIGEAVAVAELFLK